jgi:hypothetical protein
MNDNHSNHSNHQEITALLYNCLLRQHSTSAVEVWFLLAGWPGVASKRSFLGFLFLPSGQTGGATTRCPTSLADSSVFSVVKILNPKKFWSFRGDLHVKTGPRCSDLSVTWINSPRPTC